MLRKSFFSFVAIAATLICTSVLANSVTKTAPKCPAPFKPGFLIGLQVGNGNTHMKSLVPSGKDTYQNAAGGRFYLGYQFSQHFGVQAGITYITSVKVGGTKVDNSWFTDLVGVMSVGGIGTHGIDNSGFGGFAKAGFGYARHEFAKGTFIGPSGIVAQGQHSDAWNLVYGAGVTYTFPSKDIMLDIAYESHLGRPRAPISNYMPAMDLYSLGVEYLFNFS